MNDKQEQTLMPVQIAGIDFHNPFAVGSGPTVKTVDMIRQIDQAGWGAAFVKLAIDPAPYISRDPRYSWWKKEKLHSFTLEKRLTLDQALRLVEGGKKQAKLTKIFSNMSYDGPEQLEGWVKMARAFENAGADGNELNMCCPNMSFNVEVSGEKTAHQTGASLGQYPEPVAAIVRAVKAETTIPLFVKITPEAGNIAEVSQAAFKAGADVVASVGNRLGVAPIPDIENPLISSQRLNIDNGMTCLSGPWLKPLALRDVYEIRKLVGPGHPIVGYGGMAGWKDYVEMIMMGADMVGICTDTMLRGFDFLAKEIGKLREYMERHGYGSPQEMIDLLVPTIQPANTLRSEEAVSFVNSDQCTGCELCSRIGHCYAIGMKPGKGHETKNRKGMVAEVDPADCTGCSTCFDVCPAGCFEWKPVSD